MAAKYRLVNRYLYAGSTTTSEAALQLLVLQAYVNWVPYGEMPTPHLYSTYTSIPRAVIATYEAGTAIETQISNLSLKEYC